MLTTIIYWAIFGLVVGLIARFLVPGRDPLGCIATTLLGIAGSFVGGFIGRATHWNPAGRWTHLLFSVGGAILLILLVRMFRSRPRRE